MEDFQYLPKVGRGAVTNSAGRFEKLETSRIDDGWTLDRLMAEDAPQKIKTELHLDTSKSILNEIKSEDMPYGRSINPYRGCEHGCIYCYARPTHGWLGYSAGLDFETKIFYKANAAALLRDELAKPNFRLEPVLMGGNTDCYQPVERDLKITRSILEVLSEANHPFTIITKSGLIVRDLDILAPMAAKKLVRVAVSLTTLDASLSCVMEPRAAAPQKRLATIKALSDQGVDVTVMTAPLIPALNDMELEQLLEEAYAAGARRAHYTLIRLPYELKDIFSEWLEVHRKDRAAHVLSLIRETRGGKLYDADYSQRRKGKGVYADLLGRRFQLATKRLGFNRDAFSFDTSLFRTPPGNGQLGFAF